MKLNTPKFYIISIFIVATFFITSCENEAIFSAIETEVEIDDDPSVKGNVISMALIGTEEKGTLYVANGNIYYKDVTASRGWEKFDEPESGKYTSQIASNGTDLYAFVQDSTNGGSVYYCNPDTDADTQDWTPVSDEAYALFDNSEIDSNRNAYITQYNSSTKNYEVRFLTENNIGAVLVSDADTIMIKAANSNGTDYFSDNMSFCSYGEYLFIADNDDYTVYYYNNSNNKAEQTDFTYESKTWTSTGWTTDDNDDINSMFIALNDADTPVLYIATDEGIEECYIEGFTLTNIDISDQCESTIGSYNIYGIWRYGSGTYASSIETSGTDDNKLWGSYDDANWNCE